MKSTEKYFMYFIPLFHMHIEHRSTAQRTCMQPLIYSICSFFLLQLVWVISNFMKKRNTFSNFVCIKSTIECVDRKLAKLNNNNGQVSSVRKSTAIMPIDLHFQRRQLVFFIFMNLNTMPCHAECIVHCIVLNQFTHVSCSGNYDH